MKKIMVLGFAALGLALAACSSPQGSSPASRTAFNAKEAVWMELNAQKGGPLVYERFLLTKSAWDCIQNCPGPMTLRFSPSSAADLGVDIIRNGNISRSKVWLFPGFKFDVEGDANFQCRLVTNDVPQCDVPNVATGMTDHLFFKRQ